MDAVARRESLVDRLEADRIQEEEEENIRQMMEESGKVDGRVGR